MTVDDARVKHDFSLDRQYPDAGRKLFAASVKLMRIEVAASQAACNRSFRFPCTSGKQSRPEREEVRAPARAANPFLNDSDNYPRQCPR